MPNNTTNDAGAAAPAFVLRELKSSDVWQLVRVLRRFNLREARKLIDQDLVKKSKFEKPMKLVDGELVPMLPDEWTAAQRKAFKAAKAANDELTWQALDILINNIAGCEDEVNKLLAMGIDKDINYIRNLRFFYAGAALAGKDGSIAKLYRICNDVDQMIDTGLAVGCLSEVIQDVWKQDAQDLKVQRWLLQGHGKSYKQFWGEDYGG